MERPKSEHELKPYLKNVGISPIDGRIIAIHRPGVDIIEHDTGITVQVPVETSGEIDLLTPLNSLAVEIHI